VGNLKQALGKPTKISIALLLLKAETPSFKIETFVHIFPLQTDKSHQFLNQK